ncbi:hypothetical protein FF011L_55070 [Roseimaritima multifibrata]|uniref:Uncharacterized protein n=1 Tax=Roseimaritima multifibrata TaxID=1930274 RepID=A0A517MP84_9BACT|nr:hypothetical protein FF011L_55070 [Roseimaritima multifibrata]
MWTIQPRGKRWREQEDIEPSKTQVLLAWQSSNGTRKAFEKQNLCQSNDSAVLHPLSGTCDKPNNLQSNDAIPSPPFLVQRYVDPKRGEDILHRIAIESQSTALADNQSVQHPPSFDGKIVSRKRGATLSFLIDRDVPWERKGC